jgi:choline-sulfatase
VPLSIRLAARGESLHRLSIGQELRNVVFAPPPYRASVVVKVPTNARLRFGYGALDKQPHGVGAVRFEVAVVETDGTRTRVFSDSPRLLYQAQRGRWLDAEVDLNRWAGKQVRLEFTTAAPQLEGGAAKPDNWVVWSEPVVCAPAPDASPNVVLIVLDAVRSDHLGCYGYSRPTSPSIDGLARQGMLFREAESQASWTIPSMASLLTSHYPSETRDDTTPPGTVDPRVTTLATLLYRRGIATGAVTAQSLLGPPAGYDQGFELWNQQAAFAPNHTSGRSAARVTDAACAWLDRHADQQFALYLHYMDTHYDWKPPEPFRSRLLRADGVTDPDVLAGDADGILYRSDGTSVLADKRNVDCLISLYDGEIAHTDHELQRLFDKLTQLGLYDRTLIIVTADHGEGFVEHGFLHGSTLYQEVLRVPLIMKPPRSQSVRRREVSESVRLLDVAPTILDLAGVDTPRHMRGRSLRAELKHERQSEDNFAQTGVFGVLGVPTSEAARVGDHKVIHRLAGDAWELYDLDRDPAEKSNLAAQQPGQLRRMKASLAAFRDQARPGAAFTRKPSGQRLPGAPVDEEMRRRLRSLGYVQ